MKHIFEFKKKKKLCTTTRGFQNVLVRYRALKTQAWEDGSVGKHEDSSSDPLNPCKS